MAAVRYAQDDVQPQVLSAAPGLDAAVPPGAAPAQPLPNAVNTAVSPTDQSAQDPETHMMQFFRDPARLTAAAALAAEYGRPDVMKWLERGHQAQQENTMEALQNLMAGNKQGAIDNFNMAGKFKATAIADGKDPGTYDVTLHDGSTRTIDPRKEYMSLLSPPQLAMNEYRDQMVAARQDANDSRRDAANARSEATVSAAETRSRSNADIAQARLDAAKGLNDAKTTQALASAALSNRRADNVGSKAEKPAKFNLNVVQAQSRAAATTPDPVTGKPMVDVGHARIIFNLAQRARDDDPSLSESDAVSIAAQKADDLRGGATSQAEKDADQAEAAAPQPGILGRVFGATPKVTYPGNAPDRATFVRQQAAKKIQSLMANPGLDASPGKTVNANDPLGIL